MLPQLSEGDSQRQEVALPRQEARAKRTFCLKLTCTTALRAPEQWSPVASQWPQWPQWPHRPAPGAQGAPRAKGVSLRVFILITLRTNAKGSFIILFVCVRKVSEIPTNNKQ
jgi:hypothetical protein